MNSFKIEPDTTSKNILLTGAGFTYNFGGFLGVDMWNKIHNNLTSSNHKKLIELIKKTFDYEELYEEVISNNYYIKDERDACTDSILKIYKEMDKNIYDSYKLKLREDNHIAPNKLREFLSLFGSSKEPGFFFTLNQDLFIERFCVPIVQPGFPFLDCKRLYYDSASNGYPNPDHLKTIDIPEQLDNEECKKELYYIKLHGSYEWRKHGALVIGTKKMDRIKAEPILNWYYQLFKDVLSSGGRRLVVIGYRFKDKHINNVILDSIKNNGLRINIICPNEAKKFKTDTLGKRTEDEAATIWNAVDKYYNSDLEKFFPFNRGSQDYDDLCDYLRR